MNYQTWNRTLPERFLIGGEKRFNTKSHRFDQCWLLRQSRSKPFNIVIETYPEAPDNNLQVSPIFSEHTQISETPNDFNPAYYLENFSWDWAEFHFQPLKQLKARSLYWAPDSGVIFGEYWITNNADHTRVIQLDLICSLRSQGEKSHIKLEEFKGRPILTGNIGEQSLVLFLTQDPVPNIGPHLSLQTTLSVPSNKEKKIQWICTLTDSKTTALEILEQVIHMNWPEEISHRKIAQQGQLEITTGDSNWDYALALSQKQAKLIVNQISSIEQPESSPEIELSPFQALMLLRSMQPLEPGAIKNILALVFKQISDQEQSEKNMGGNLTPPLLASELLWQTNQMGFDNKIWSEYLPLVSEWLVSWFSTDLDKDQDGIPELVRLLIFNLEDNGVEDTNSINQLVPFPFLESPGLGALLFSDLCKLEVLVRIAGTSMEPTLAGKKESLLNYLHESQNPISGNFQTRDSQSHIVIEGFIISQDIRPGLNILRADFQQPTRIGIQHQRLEADQTSGEFSIVFHGQDLRGNSRVEEVHSKDFTWGKEVNWGLTESIFSKLNFCTLKDSNNKGHITLVAPSTSDQDITLTLPLWAGILSDRQAQSYIQNVLLDPDQYGSPYGFRTRAGIEGSTVQFSWNLFLGQALTQYGKLDQAADLIGRWMAALIPSVLGSGSMYSAYHAETGKGSGQIDTLESLFPVSFFLDVLGVQFIQDRSLIIKCQNPFPWPVKLHFRGVIIKCGKDQTTIFRPGQDTITLTSHEEIKLDLA